MNSFFTSTQYKNWTKTEEQLEKIEKQKIEKIIKRINDVNLLIKAENEKLIAEYNKNSNTPPPVTEKFISYKKLTNIIDEKFLIINYSNKLIQIVNNLKEKASFSLKNLAITYFRRFFLKKSIIDYNPNFLMASSLYLAAKVCSLNFSKEAYLKIFPILAEGNNYFKLFEYEFYLCTILEYDFFVFNPYQALIGFIYSLEKKEFFISQDKNNYIDQDDFKNECMNLIDKMYLTDNIFLFTYSEIALASIFIQCEQKNMNTFNIAEKLDLIKMLNIKEFLDNKVAKMKKKLEELPKLNIKEGEEKSNNILRNVRHFLRDFPKYQAQLDKERKNLREKMNNFEKNFEKFEPKKK